MDLRYENDLPPEGLTMESLMEALFFRDEFLSIASHELKTPLTTLKLQAQVLRRKSRHAENYSKIEVNHLLDLIEAQTGRMSDLINDMLDISRIRSGRLIMTKTFFNLSERVNEELDQGRLRFNQEFKISFQISDDIWCLGDEDRILQSFKTILNNAARYGRGLPIEVKLIKKKKKIYFSVKDEGQGIASRDLERIFHRFQRAVAAKQVSGLGLGLYIAREIIESHQGKIKVISELDQGSTFSIELNTGELQ